MFRDITCCLVIVYSTTVACLTDSASAAILVFDTVALTGDDGARGPGLGSGIVYNIFDRPSISPNSTIGFRGFLTGGDSDGGIWKNSGSGNEVVALTRVDSALGPGLGPGSTFWRLDQPNFLTNESMSFRAILTDSGGGRGNTGMWLESSQGQTPVAIEGTDGALGPGLGAGVTYRNIDGYSGNTSGTIVLNSTTGSSNRGGVFWSEGLPAVAVALENTDGPLGPGLGANIEFRGIGGAVVNRNGMVVFGSVLTGSAINFQDFQTRHTVTNGGSPVALMQTNTDGPLGPGLGPGGEFRNTFSTNASVNTNGKIAFGQQAVAPGLGTFFGLWRSNQGSFDLLARSGTDGSQGPGLGSGVSFLSSLQFPHFQVQLADNDDAVYLARLSGSGVTFDNNVGVWLSNQGGNLPIARKGPAGLLGPGLDPGVVFSDFSVPVINARGEVVFQATVTGPNGSAKGLWSYIDGELTNMVVSGTMFDVDPTNAVDLRLITNVDFSFGFGSNTGRAGIDDNGVVPFILTFADQSQGVFTVQIPEPTCVVVFLVNGWLMLRRRTRQR